MKEKAVLTIKLIQPFYIQDEWYVVVPRPFLGILAFTALMLPCMSMAKNDYIQDEWYVEITGA